MEHQKNGRLLPIVLALMVVAMIIWRFLDYKENTALAYEKAELKAENQRLKAASEDMKLLMTLMYPESTTSGHSHYGGLDYGEHDIGDFVQGDRVQSTTFKLDSTFEKKPKATPYIYDEYDE